MLNISNKYHLERFITFNLIHFDFENLKEENNGKTRKTEQRKISE